MNNITYPSRQKPRTLFTQISVRRWSAAVALWSALSALPSASAAIINKASNTDNLDLTSSWTGGVVPGAADIASFGTAWNVATPNTLTIGSGVSLQGIALTGGTQFVTINAGTGGTLALGSSGIDFSGITNTRTLTLGSTVTLASDQVWRTGGAASNTAAQITASGVISGAGRLTVDGSSQGYVFLNAANTFSGGFTLNSGGAVKVGSASVANNGVVTSGAFGTGTVTINGGTLYGSGVDNAAPSYVFNGNFAVNNGAGVNVANGRFSLGGSVDLANGTRTVTLGRSANLATLQSSGNESARFIAVANGPAISIANGTLRFVGDNSTNGTNLWSAVGINSAMSFVNNAGLILGQNVITRFGSTDLFANGANAPVVTVETGGVFNLGTANVSASLQVASLNGAGTVTSLNNTGVTRTLTLGNNNQSGNFSGKILNGADFSTVFPAADMTGITGVNGVVAVTKIGTGTQTFSGVGNTYTGATTISAGTLALGANNALSTGSAISVANGATLAMNSFTATASVLTLEGGGKLSFSLGSPENTTALLTLTNAFNKGAAGAYTFDLSGGVVGTYKLVSFGSTTFASGGDFTALLNAGYTGSFALNTVDKTLSFSISSIPEPASFSALAGIAVLGWISTRRRRR